MNGNHPLRSLLPLEIPLVENRLDIGEDAQAVTIVYGAGWRRELPVEEYVAGFRQANANAIQHSLYGITWAHRYMDDGVSRGLPLRSKATQLAVQVYL